MNLQTEIIDSLVGTLCWAVIASPITGINLHIYFGNKIERKEPLKNHRLPEDVQKFEPEFSLYSSCPWRLMNKTNVLFSAYGDKSHGEDSIYDKLSVIVGKHVTDVRITNPGLDLIVEFDNKIVLMFFSIATEASKYDDNWSLQFPDGRIVYSAWESHLLIE